MVLAMRPTAESRSLCTISCASRAFSMATDAWMESAFQFFVGRSERTTFLIQHLEDTDRLSVAVPHRHREHVVRPIAGLLIHFGIETGIVVCVGNVDDLAGLRNVSGESFAERKTISITSLPRSALDQSRLSVHPPHKAFLGRQQWI